MNSETKQTETVEFGAEEGSLPGPSKENGWLVFKRPKHPYGIQGRVFIGKI